MAQTGRARRLGWAGLVVTAAVACLSPAPDARASFDGGQDTATLVVTVETATGDPVPAAEVRLGDQRVYTDRAGEAVMVVPAGTLELWASAEGFEDAVIPVTVGPGEAAVIGVVLTRLAARAAPGTYGL
jgi:uncharacterized membrane protein